jgi:hypothetical protein
MTFGDSPFPAAIPHQRWFLAPLSLYCPVRIFKSYRARIGPYSAHVPPPPPYYSAVRAEVGPLAYLFPSLAGCTARQAEVCKNITRSV